MNLVYVYCPDSGNECMISVPERSSRYLTSEAASQCLGIVGPCDTDFLNCRRNQRSSSRVNDSGWFLSSRKEDVRGFLKQWIVPDLAEIISEYGDRHHTVLIEPLDSMTSRCRDFDAFCDDRKIGKAKPTAWYEWAFAAASLEAELAPRNEGSWLDAFGPAALASENRAYHLAFGESIVSVPVTKSMAIVACVVRRSRRQPVLMASILGTGIDTNGKPVGFRGSPAVFRAIKDCTLHVNRLREKWVRGWRGAARAAINL